jgi:hypothetical protein
LLSNVSITEGILLRSVRLREVEVTFKAFPNGTIVHARKLLFQKEGFVITIAFVINNLCRLNEFPPFASVAGVGRQCKRER